jgi:hypothetical protein
MFILCVGSSLATGLIPVEGVLVTVSKMPSFRLILIENRPEALIRKVHGGEGKWKNADSRGRNMERMIYESLNRRGGCRIKIIERIASSDIKEAKLVRGLQSQGISK